MTAESNGFLATDGLKSVRRLAFHTMQSQCRFFPDGFHESIEEAAKLAITSDDVSGYRDFHEAVEALNSQLEFPCMGPDPRIAGVMYMYIGALIASHKEDK